MPPAPVTVMLPKPPLQPGLTALYVAVNAVGCVTTTLAVFVQPLASVIVTVYVPAPSPVAMAVVWATPVFHKYVYGAVPPVMLSSSRVAVPVVPPLHNTGVVVNGAHVMMAGCVNVTVQLVVQLFLSFTITVYVPAARLFAMAVVVTGTVFHV